MSHYDADHIGGVQALGESPGVSVGAFYDRGGDRNVKDSQTYRDYYDYTTGLGARHPVDIGDTFTLCDGADQVTFSVVSAGADGTAIGGLPVSEENDRGLCIHVEYRDFDLATCGDINGTATGSRAAVETPAAAAVGDVEVVKINHHGSSYSSNPNMGEHPRRRSRGPLRRQELLRTPLARSLDPLAQLRVRPLPNELDHGLDRRNRRQHPDTDQGNRNV